MPAAIPVVAETAGPGLTCHAAQADEAAAKFSGCPNPYWQNGDPEAGDQ